MKPSILINLRSPRYLARRESWSLRLLSFSLCYLLAALALVYGLPGKHERRDPAQIRTQIEPNPRPNAAVLERQ